MRDLRTQVLPKEAVAVDPHHRSWTCLERTMFELQAIGYQRSGQCPTRGIPARHSRGFIQFCQESIQPSFECGTIEWRRQRIAEAQQRHQFSKLPIVRVTIQSIARSAVAKLDGKLRLASGTAWCFVGRHGRYSTVVAGHTSGQQFISNPVQWWLSRRRRTDSPSIIQSSSSGLPAATSVWLARRWWFALPSRRK